MRVVRFPLGCRVRLRVFVIADGMFVWLVGRMVRPFRRSGGR